MVSPPDGLALSIVSESNWNEYHIFVEKAGSAVAVTLHHVVKLN